MERIQFVVVSGSEERKQRLHQQFSELEIDCPIHYLEAKVLDVEASNDYVPSNATLIERRTILSTRSHICAIEFAGKESSPEFTLILEDDVALHKTEFKSKLIELLNTFDTLIKPHSNVLSLGWIPNYNYSNYKDRSSKYRLDDIYKILLIFTPGTQAYLIKKEVAKEYTPLFKHDTHTALCKTMLEQKNSLVTDPLQLVAFDNFGLRLLNQCVLFPPIVIEQESKSLIRETTENPYWKQFFHKYEHIRKEYWSF